MSGRRSVVSEGQSVCVEDATRYLSDAAAMDDRATELFTLPGSVTNASNTKRVMPLDDDTSVSDPHLLLNPSGTTPGAVTVRAAWYAAAVSASGTGPAAPEMLLAATQYTPKDTAPLLSNTSGGVRYVAVYAVVSRQASETGVRLFRDSSDNEGVQTITLADVPAVTIETTPQCALRSDALAAEAPDTSSSWTFHLGYVVVAAGYTAGSPIAQNATGGSTYLEQGAGNSSVGAGAAGTGIRQSRVAASVMSIVSAGGANAPTASALTRRMHRAEQWEGQFIHTASGNALTLDSSIDWRRRRIRVSLVRAASDGGAFKEFEDVAVAGSSVALEALGATGTDGGNAVVMTASSAGAGGADVTFAFSADGSGHLKVVIGGAPKTSGDAYVVVVEASARYSR